MINTKTLLARELNRLEALDERLPAVHSGRPSGSLRANIKRNGHTYYYDSVTRENGAIKRTTERLGDGSAAKVREIKRARYVKELRKMLAGNIKALRKALTTATDFDFDDVVRAMPAAFQVETDCYAGILRADGMTGLSCGFPDDRQSGRREKWMSSRYDRNPAPIERAFITITGEVVRSKSELIIFDLLVKYGVPFRYDCALELTDLNGLETVRYPDFTILLADGSLLYWEHLGMLSDERYLSGVMAKLALYHKNGLTVGDELILTSDAADGSINVEAIAKIIESQILPRL